MQAEVIAAAEAYATGRKQREKRESSVQTFGSVGELRQIIDGPGFRRMGAMLKTCGSTSGWTRRAYLPE
ncbi:hypothetical protein [Streptomyces sp. BE133]|uniref:hypothetical protein n=1 Tax=Streptomyces sp. BE133 TaxID=3002523 RepID=UPI002E7910A7|nr:hypothetical protein [Streptomyces sp. BE133]MEE1810079.1 hypothetical protein [Streptomyces sp. BE133]